MLNSGKDIGRGDEEQGVLELESAKPVRSEWKLEYMHMQVVLTRRQWSVEPGKGLLLVFFIDYNDLGFVQQFLGYLSHMHHKGRMLLGQTVDIL